MIRIIVLTLSILLVADQALAGKPKKPPSTKASASLSRPSSSPHTIRSQYVRKQPSKAKRAVNNIRNEMMRAHTDVRTVERQLATAQRSENRLKSEIAKASPERQSALNKNLRSATANRANWEMSLDSAKTRYRDVHRVYKAANHEYRYESSFNWKKHLKNLNAVDKTKTKPKARRIKFKKKSLGQTGSGQPRPNVQPLGILVKGARVSVTLTRIRRDANGRIINADQVIP